MQKRLRVKTQPSKLKVSVLCLAFNQDKYIRQALDGFVMQETDFDFEVLIHDDASTDDTAKIIREYEKKYPKIIKPIYQKENQYSKGVRITISYQLPRANGEYIALCEGDDYWTDSLKLQKQVDFMDQHPDYSMCFHKVSVKYEKNEKPDSIYPDVLNKGWYTHTQLMQLNYIQTNSVLYRRQDYSKLPKNVMPGDWFLHLYHASFGKIKIIDEVMSVYRKHSEGIWWNYDRDRGKIWMKHGLAHISMWIELLDVYRARPHLKKHIEKQLVQMLMTVSEVDKKYGTDHLSNAYEQYPQIMLPLTAKLLIDLKQRETELQTSTAELTVAIGRVEILGRQLDKENARLANRVKSHLRRLKHSIAQSRLIDENSAKKKRAL